MKRAFLTFMFSLKSTVFIGLFFVLYCCSSTVYAQKFYAQVAGTSIPMGQTMEVAFVAENTNIRGFNPPAFKDFQVVGGPNQSSSTTFINGARSSIVSFSYFITPKHEGLCVIEAASAKTDNSVFNSAQIKITVTKAAVPNKNKNSNTAENADPNISTEDISNSVFIKVITTKSEAFIGEPIGATFRLYTDRQLYNVQFPKAAAFNGFWKNDIPVDQNQAWNYENINGKRYAYIDVQKVVLFPQKAGKAEITPIGMEAVIQQQTRRKARSFYEELFGANVSVNEIPIKLKSNAISIKVKDFPSKQPLDFNGIVGVFTLEASLEKKPLKVDEPFRLQLKIKGNGNFQAIEAPTLFLPEEFEVYDPETKENTSLNGSSVSGTKSFDYLMVAKEPGNYELPAMNIVCFNPATQQYYKLPVSSFRLNIMGDSSVKSSTSPTQMTTKKNDIQPIVTVAKLDKKHPLLFGSGAYFSLMISPILLFIALLMAKKRKDAINGDFIGNRQRKASKVAVSRLSVTYKHLQKNESIPFFNEVNKTILEYLSHKLLIASADMTTEFCRERLSTLNIDNAIIDRCFSLINQTELALYSPSVENDELKTIYQESLEIISLLEEKLK